MAMWSAATEVVPLAGRVRSAGLTSYRHYGTSPLCTYSAKSARGTRSGQKLRLQGKGVPGSRSRPPGDLFAVVQIVPPQKLDARSRELLEEFAKRNPGQ